MTASISNDQFHPDKPLGDNGHGTVPEDLKKMFSLLQSSVILPDGQIKPGPTWQAYGRFSAADQLIDQDGTYKIVLAQPATTMTTFKHADGNPGRIFGPSPVLPENTTDVVRRVITSRVETFISKNTPTPVSLLAGEKGIVLGGDSHPNDLFAGETGSFALTFNGQPLEQAAEVHIVAGGTRHRNQRNEIKITTSSQGEFEASFPEAGFYLLEVEVSLPGEKNSAVDMYHHSLYVTLEVFPQ